jgi:hypothetical protein
MSAAAGDARKTHGVGDIFAFGPALHIFWFHRGD